MDNTKGKVIKAGVGYTIGNYLLKGLAVFTIPIFSRLLSEEEYGYYNLFMTYVSIFTIIVGLALYASFKNAKYKESYSYDQYVSNCLTIILINGAIVCVILFFARNLFVNLVGNNTYIVFILVLFSTSSAIITSYNSVLGLEYKYKSYLVIAAFNAIFNIILSLLLIYSSFISDNAIARIIGGFIPENLIAIYIIFSIFKKSPPSISRKYMKFAFSFSLPLVAHGLSQIILNSFDRIMISDMVGLKENGIYSFSYNIFSILQVTSASLIVVWETWFYKSMNERKYLEIKKYGNALLVFFAMSSCFVLIMAPEIIWVLGGEKYQDALFTVVPIIIGGFFSIVYYFPAEIEYYLEKTKYIAVATVIAAVLNIVLNQFFIPKYGYVAAAYTTLATYLVYFIFHYILSRRLLKVVLYPPLRIISCSMAVCVSGAIVAIIKEQIVIRIIIAVIIVVTFLLYIYKIGLLSHFMKNKDAE